MNALCQNIHDVKIYCVCVYTNFASYAHLHLYMRIYIEKKTKHFFSLIFSL